MNALVIELVEDHDRSTFRAVYTVTFPRAVNVLHIFQKKSRLGIKNPLEEIELLRSCFRFAQEHYDESSRRKDRHG